MAIEIDDPKVEANIRELMELTGETDWEKAVELASREKLQRIKVEAALRAASNVPDRQHP